GRGGRSPRRCGEAGAPSPLRFGAAESGASIGRRARRLIELRRRPRLPATLFGLARVPHVFRRHAEIKRAMGFRRCMLRGLATVRGEWHVCAPPSTCGGCGRWASSSRSAVPRRRLLWGCDPARRTSRERGRRRSAYEASERNGRSCPSLGGAESKRRRRPRSRGPQSWATLLAPGAATSAARFLTSTCPAR